MEHLLHNSTPPQKRVLIHLAFSGALNMYSERNAFSAADKAATVERYAHFKNRLETLGLSPANPSMMEKQLNSVFPRKNYAISVSLNASSI